MVLRLLGRLAATLLIGLTAPGFVEDPGAEPATVIPTDPAVRQGQLANGLRYALMSNDRPAGGVSIRLRFDVGSYEEPETYRGIAHFLEHMAFNGTRGLPEGELARRFAEAGVAFGRDQNASTSMFATTYKIDLPSSGSQELDLAFDWMRDIADGLLLTPEAVAREQGVILAEHNTRLGPAHDWREAYQAFAAPHARSRVRPPIGTPETIRAIDSVALTSFHNAWYRPDNAFLTVSGDMPLEALEARVRVAFADWPAATGPMVRARATPLDLKRSLDVFVRAEPSLSRALSACRLSPWRTHGPDTFARRRTFITEALWISILNRRLQLLSLGQDAPFTSASINISNWSREAEAVCLNVAPPVGGDWRRAFASALLEVRRLELHGVEAHEVARQVDAQKRINTSAAQRAEDRYSSSLADGLLSIFPLHEFDAGAFISPQDLPAIYDAVVASISPEDIRADFARGWNGSEPLLAVTLPDPPTATEIRTLWNEAMAASAEAGSPEAKAAEWAYTDFGPPGHVVSREQVMEPEFTRVRFANGLVLNLKSVAYTRDLVQLSVQLGAGRAGVPDADFHKAGLGSAFVVLGGTERHSLQEIRDLFPGRRIAVELQMLDDVFQLAGSTRPDDLEIQLQLVAALLTEPGFRDDFASQRRQAVDSIYRTWRTHPETVMALTMSEAVSPRSPRGLPPREALDSLSLADLERIFRPLLTSAPLEVTLVGDMDEAQMIALVAGTLGALPPRTSDLANRPDVFLVRYGHARPAVEAVHEGSPDRALFRALWPLFVAEPSRRREQLTLQLLRAVLQERVRNEVREALGASYSPGVALSFEDGGDEGRLSIDAATSPADLDRVRDAVLRVVREVSMGQITEADLETARRPVLARLQDSRASNGWWFDLLNGSAREPHKLTDGLTWAEIYRDIALDELKVAARAWLSGEPLTGVVLPARAPAGSAEASN